MNKKHIAVVLFPLLVSVVLAAMSLSVLSVQVVKSGQFDTAVIVSSFVAGIVGLWGGVLLMHFVSRMKR